jgi:NAD(P)-dependent dehydrogenase (short-subunit alcohol dehydrogenase family)
MRVRDAVVVIVGASSGIGRATALAFAKKGADVVLAARGVEALEAAAQQCRILGAETLVVPTDVTDADAVEALAQAAEDRFGRIDVWVNCAAVSVYAPFLDVPLADFRRVLDVNIMGCVHGARAALPRMRQQGRGRLITLSSVAGAVPQPYAQPYPMSKAAVRALDGSLRQELQLDGFSDVEVCTVLPAGIDTPFFQHAANYTGRRVRAFPPVYPPERVARTVVGLVRKPQREAPVGRAARVLIRQVKLAPGLTERMMAQQVEKTHLSPTESAPDNAGILFEPEPGPGAITGGWHGKTKAGLRRAASLALVGAGAVAAGRWLRRPAGARSSRAGTS